MKVYINYPDPHISIHRNNECAEIQKQGKEDQRLICIAPEKLIEVLVDIANKRYKFGSTKEINDIWLEIALNTEEQNTGLVYVIQAILGEIYSWFKNAEVIEHDC